MAKPYDTHEQFSEQDYGPWLDRLSLYEVNGKVYLKEEFGYSKPYDKNWYELSAKPEKTLKDTFGGYTSGGWTGSGDTTVFEEDLGVTATECDDPTRS